MAALTHADGLDENGSIVYCLTLVPLEAHDLDKTVPPIKTPYPYNPAHFFLDDQMLVSYGHEDATMGSTIMPVREAVARHKFCADLPTEL